MQIQVIANPAKGHKQFFRLGRAFTPKPTILTVVDKPTSDDEITPEQYATLRASTPHIVAMPLSDLDSGAEIELSAKLIKAEAEIAELRKQLADQAEVAAIEGQRMSREAEQQASQIVMLTSEIASLRASLGKRHK